jgi:aryl-phospho-beta-D-glucosidase BglC (GH1 family)
VDEAGKKVILRGFNLGGWLMMEGYILYAPNIAERIFKDKFKKALGDQALIEFERNFRDNFVQESDFRNIASWGFNCVRLPFNHKLVEQKPYQYSKQGLSYLEKAVKWAKKYGIWVILDLHAAPGSQSGEWHADSIGEALLWKNKSNKKRTIKLWCFLADAFKNEKTVAGYDLLNEPIVANNVLNRFYQELTSEIRKIDKNHIIFLEPANWAQDLKHLKKPETDNVAFSIHCYWPLDFCFNFKPGINYPFSDKTYAKQMKNCISYLNSCFKISQKSNVPLLLGEFGVNSRSNSYGEMNYISDLIKVFNDLNFHWTYWTYKAVKNTIFPDGLYHYLEDPKWVNRQGPLYGWDNYADLWLKYKKQIIRSWRTDSFKKDDKLLAALKKNCDS